ncbi:hypothetical protein [Zoogloea sp.]|uniref:J domain-containing protein n=1 Tax=Zoogloea sp. TaxID=49181 RepID=UPI00262BB4A8|nr:hypothetical protein [Zoogloea sp.]MDD3352426.1 hypothetical protein [Zoogloea sp.]
MARSTLYDLLGLSPQASVAEILAARDARVAHYQSAAHGLPPADAENRIKALREAAWILSDPGRRAAYDARLAPSRPESGFVRSDVSGDEVPPGLSSPLHPIKVEIAEVKWTPLRIMTFAIGGLMIVGMLIQIFFSVFAFRQAGRLASGEVPAEMQQRVMEAERRQTYGDLTEDEIRELENRAAQQRLESARRYEAQQQERLRKEEEYQRQRALEERTRYADKVSADLAQAEETARLKAEREKRQQEEAARRAEAEEERRLQERLARERARWQRELQN